MFGRLILSFCLVMMLAGCSTAGKQGGTSLPDMDSAAAQTFVNRCGACHAVPHPARLTYQGWQYLVPLMEQRMAERGMLPLTTEDREIILAYLQENAR
jgi:hypothetical protein